MQQERNETKTTLKSAGLDKEYYKEQAKSFYNKIVDIIENDGCRDYSYLQEKANKALSLIKDLKNEEQRQVRIKNMVEE